MAWPFIILDFTIRQDLCNKRCMYCGLTTAHVPPLGIERGLVGLRGKDGAISHAETPRAIFTRVLKLVAAARAECRMPLVKLSGGELTAIPDWPQLIEEIAEQHVRVQLLTNGTCLQGEFFSQLRDISDLSIQISLDGIDEDANAPRGLDELEISRLKATIVNLVEIGVGVELNCVLTRSSLKRLRSFCAWANLIVGNEPGMVCILPKPVHGPESHRFYPSSDDISEFGASWEDLPQAVIPPREYMQRLVDTLRYRQRRWACYVPYFVLGMDDNGLIPVCTCGPHLGNLESDSDIASHVPAFAPTSAVNMCYGCMTYYELLNLVVEGKVNGTDLQTLPSFRSSQITERIMKTAEILRNHF